MVLHLVSLLLQIPILTNGNEIIFCHQPNVANRMAQKKDTGFTETFRLDAFSHMKLEGWSEYTT